MSQKPDDPLLPYKQEEIPELLTIKEAAKRLNLEYRQLLSAVNEGVVPFYQLPVPTVSGKRRVVPTQTYEGR
ncbi:MAG: hypothetical protein KDI13_11190 [Alphaproteobacteria bacterium]|nr:hypothetical protein [Alphaproteobacteria bacterium]